ncbi:MAG: 4Fe-4S binding protein [Candidatus Lokiarchaeota archaeon]|nr:4Fe-4S binding protein [Candidatus Lokiarchaeota archaeon]
MFPKINRTIKNNQESVKIQFLTQSQELIHDKTKCVGCGTCSRVCPKEAVNRGPVGASIRIKTNDGLVTEVYDPNKCVFCGTCVVMCPFSALSLKINNEVLKLEDIPLVKQGVLPKLEFEAKKIKNKDGIERVVKQYTSGNIKIVDDECAGGCDTCYDVCPSSAISIPPKSKKGWEKTSNVVVDEEKCIFCGTCDNACPTGAVKLNIKEVKSSGKFNEPFWPDLVVRLKTMRGLKRE